MRNLGSGLASASHFQQPALRSSGLGAKSTPYAPADSLDVLLFDVYIVEPVNYRACLFSVDHNKAGIQHRMLPWINDLHKYIY